MRRRLVLLRRRRSDEGGYAALLVALLAMTILLPLCALSVDIGRMYVEAQRVQAAADAAATAGVTMLPDDFAGARSAAIAAAKRNGYSGSSADIVVGVGDKPTQLSVSITSRFHNAFAAAFGSPNASVTRSAIADYNGPAPMGSPCNTFGNEPPGTANAGPAASQLSVADGGASCSSNPQLWAAIAGPNTPKGNGDQFMTRTCASSDTGCSGGKNSEFKPTGYVYMVRATTAAIGRTVRLQIYDAPFAPVGDDCSARPSNVNDNNWNDWANTDAIARYARTAGTYCPGDTYAGESPIVTSFGLRAPTDTYDPLNGEPIVECGKQYPGYTESQVSAAALKRGNAAYNAPLARTFRQWSTLCSFTVTQAGDYYLQVRTNVPLSTGAIGADGAYLNRAVYDQTGDDTTVASKGNNRFAMRVIDAPAGSVSISGWQAMSMFMNYSGASAEFNLVRVIPAAQTKNLVITFFDVGDASVPGTITILPPNDVVGMTSPISGCKGQGPRSGDIAGCTLLGVSSGAGFNGKTQSVSVPIPSGYSCNVEKPGGCWFRVRFAFPGGPPSDTTTWTAQITGDPVRIIQ